MKSMYLRRNVYDSLVGDADNACSELEFLPERRTTGYEATTYMELYSVEKELDALWYAGRRGVLGLVLIPLDPVDKLLRLDFTRVVDFVFRWWFE